MKTGVREVRPEEKTRNLYGTKRAVTLQCNNRETDPERRGLEVTRRRNREFEVEVTEGVVFRRVSGDGFGGSKGRMVREIEWRDQKQINENVVNGYSVKL